MTATNTTLSAVLRRTHYFQNHSDEQLASFVPHFDVIDVDEDGLVFEEKSAGDAWFLIISGEVVVSKQNPGHPPHDLSHLEVGEGFGEMALIDGSNRMATVRATTPTTLARLPRDVFTNLLADNNPAATLLLQNMARVLCQRLRELTYILQEVVEDAGPRPRAHPDALQALMKAILLQN